MKKIFLLLLLAPLFSFSQNNDQQIPRLHFDTTDNKFQYSEVVKVDSANAQQLFSRANFFIVNELKKDRVVVNLEDEGSKTIICNGIHYCAPIKEKKNIYSGVFSYKLTIQVKHGKYKIELNDLKYNIPELFDIFFMPLQLSQQKLISQSNWIEVKDYAARTFHTLTMNLQKTMTTIPDNF